MAKKCRKDESFKGKRCGIDARIMLVWLLPLLIALVGFWLLFSLVYFYTNPRLSIFGFAPALEIYAVLAFLLLLMGLPSVVWFFLRFRSISFTISASQVIIHEGVINKKKAVIPYEQIQNIHIRRPILYRLIGLSYIEIETAGVSSGFVEGYIPGISNPEEVVNEILSHVRKTGKSPANAKPTSHVNHLLTDIVEELRQIKRELQEEGKPPPEKLAEIEKKISKVAGKPEVIIAGKTCLPVDKAPPDRLEDMDAVLTELKRIRKEIEKK